MASSYFDVQLAPLRSLDDFFLGAARLEWPPFNDLKRLSNRVLNNLIYYQTNYLALCFLIFLLVGLNRPHQISVGSTVLLLALGCIAFTSSTDPRIVNIKRTYPVISLIAVVSILYLLVCCFNSLVFCLFTLALPVLLTFLHASCRLRNLKNKLTNVTEDFKSKKTPMGALFDLCGIHYETFRTD